MHLFNVSALAILIITAAFTLPDPGTIERYISLYRSTVLENEVALVYSLELPPGKVGSPSAYDVEVYASTESIFAPSRYGSHFLTEEDLAPDRYVRILSERWERGERKRARRVVLTRPLVPDTLMNVALHVRMTPLDVEDRPEWEQWMKVDTHYLYYVREGGVVLAHDSEDVVRLEQLIVREHGVEALRRYLTDPAAALSLRSAVRANHPGLFEAYYR